MTKAYLTHFVYKIFSNGLTNVICSFEKVSTVQDQRLARWVESNHTLNFRYAYAFILTYCCIFTFLKTFKYEFVDGKQSKNKWTLYCPHYLMCYCSNLYHIYNNNYSFVIPICLQPFLQAKIFRYSSHTTIRYSAHNLFISTIYSFIR